MGACSEHYFNPQGGTVINCPSGNPISEGRRMWLGGEGTGKGEAKPIKTKGGGIYPKQKTRGIYLFEKNIGKEETRRTKKREEEAKRRDKRNRDTDRVIKKQEHFWGKG